MPLSRTGAFAAGAVAALVLGSGTAVAATGGNLLLGKWNRSDAPTTLVSSKDTALRLRSGAGAPAFTVGNAVKVPRLNSDRLDGLDSRQFALTAGRTGAFDATSEAFDLDKDDTTDTFIARATCPSGTQLTGGGFEDYTREGVVLMSTPITDATWLVAVGVPEPTEDVESDVVANAVCYNPSGSLGAYRRAARETLPRDVAVPAALLAKIAQARVAKLQ